MKKILLIILGLFILLGILAFQQMDHQRYLYIEEVAMPTIPIKNSPVIEEINEKNSQILTFYAEVDIDGGRLPLSSKIFYKKDNFFRMRTMSRFGLEGDIGSNRQYFWFWSKRMIPSALYYADHKNYIRTPLKPIFDPDWLIRCLSINTIDSKSDVSFNGKDIIVKNLKETGFGTITHTMLLDSVNNRIIGHYLYDGGNRLIASAEVKEFQNIGGFVVPKSIITHWIDEKLTFVWHFKNVQCNVNLDDKVWVLPSTSQMIDMSSMSEGS
jgi:outer membrane lipoprotein-sorting protein